MGFCWLHKWKILNEAKSAAQLGVHWDPHNTDKIINFGRLLKEYPGFEKFPNYFAVINNKHPAYSDLIKLQPELAGLAFESESSDINIPLLKYATDAVCERCGQHNFKLQKEIRVYYHYLKTSRKLKDWIKTSTETALNDFWNENLD